MYVIYIYVGKSRMEERNRDNEIKRLERLKIIKK